MLWPQLAKVRAVSLDVFDTALLRPLATPSHVFHLVGEWAVSLGLSSLTPTVFAKRRRSAEQKARFKAHRQCQTAEVNLNDIYQAFLSYEPKADVMALKTLEERVEFDISKPNLEILDFTHTLLLAGYGLAFTSDTYFSRDVVRCLLDKHGYSRNAAVLVSSEYRVSKYTGGLYKELLNILACPKEQVLHVGDHLRSDVIMAKQAGLAAYHYRRRKRKVIPMKRHDPILPSSLRVGLCQSYSTPTCQDERSEAIPMSSFPKVTRVEPWQDWHFLGYAIAGPIYWGFTCWLLRELAKKPCQHVFFVARDGLLMQQLYQRLCHRLGLTPLPSTYWLTSRRALFLGTLVESELLSHLLSSRVPLPVSTYLERLGLNGETYQPALTKVGLRDDELVASTMQARLLRHVISLLLSDIAKQSAHERDLVLRYLKQIGFFDHSHVALVDIGWHATIQKKLLSILACQELPLPNIAGFYLGTFKEAHAAVTPRSTVTSYLCQFNHPLGHYGVLKQSLEILEFFFASVGESVKGYSERDGHVVAEFAKTPFNSKEDGARQCVQEGGFAFVDDMLAMLPKTRPAVPDPTDALAALRRLTLYPTRREATLVGDLTHNESLGHEAAGFLPLARPRDPSRLWQEFMEAYWKPGFMTRLFGHSLGIGKCESTAYALWGFMSATPLAWPVQRLQKLLRCRVL